MFKASRFGMIALVWGVLAASAWCQAIAQSLPPTPTPIGYGGSPGPQTPATYPGATGYGSAPMAQAPAPYPGPTTGFGSAPVAQAPAPYPGPTGFNGGPPAQAPSSYPVPQGGAFTPISAPLPGPYVGPPPDGSPSSPAPPPPPLTPPPPGGALFVPGEAPPYHYASYLSNFFFETDLYFLKPTIKGTLNGNQLQSNGSTYTYNTPGADLGATVAPLFSFGWRMPDNCGEFIFTYRFLYSSGDAQTGDQYGPLAADTRLDMNIFDFDYGTSRWSPWSNFTIQARAGIRLETIFFKNEAADGNGFFENSSSNYVAAGPHAAVQFDYQMPWIRGMGAFAKVDGALVFGQDRQNFSELYNDGSFYPFSQSRTDTSPNLTVQAGLSYTPSHWRNLQFMLGFQYERFWDVGNGPGSNGDVQDIGGFISATINF